MHRKKANNCTPSCRRQIKAENEWPHFPLSIKSEFDGKRFSTSFTRNHIDVFGSHISLTTFSSLTSRRVGCREDATTVCLCVGECKCNVISHKTLNWFLFYEFFLSRFSFSLLQLSLSCLIEFFHVFFLFFLVHFKSVTVYRRIYFSRTVWECTHKIVMSKWNPRERDRIRVRVRSVFALIAGWWDDVDDDGDDDGEMVKTSHGELEAINNIPFRLADCTLPIWKRLFGLNYVCDELQVIRDGRPMAEDEKN